MLKKFLFHKYKNILQQEDDINENREMEHVY